MGTTDMACTVRGIIRIKLVCGTKWREVTPSALHEPVLRLSPTSEDVARAPSRPCLEEIRVSLLSSSRAWVGLCWPRRSLLLVQVPASRPA